IYAVAPQLLFLLYGFEGRVLNDSPVDCQTPPPLRFAGGKILSYRIIYFILENISLIMIILKYNFNK
ncbi:MAG TPA: hypothetical protein PKV51_00915, partial [Bacillota bacterium]|nr:hypothetical protein [Bacillota bacterium]